MLINDFCGLDFGTSNSTIGIWDHSTQKIKMVPLEQGKPILRSAIFFNFENQHCLLGQEGISEYLSGTPGRLMMALKTVLGSSLMEEKTYINSRFVAYTEILGYLIKHIKQQAEKYLGHELTRVVLGRPVRFHDHDDKKDKLAEETLKKVARQQGFKTIHFQYEPIAAALAYEQNIQCEELALIVDLGGGTSDFSVIRLLPKLKDQFNQINRINQVKKINRSVHLNPSNQSMPHSDRSEDILANAGIHIGGTDFDRLLNLNTVMTEMGLGGQMRGMSGDIQVPNSFYHDLTSWHTINTLYNFQTRQALQTIRNDAYAKKPIEKLIKVIENQQGYHILNEVERGKCFLSEASKVELNLEFIENGFNVDVSRQQFENIIQTEVDRLQHTITEVIKSAGIQYDAIDSIFFTGGSTQIPVIRKMIANLMPKAKIVQGDVFESVGKGLIIDAVHKFHSG